MTKKLLIGALLLALLSPLGSGAAQVGTTEYAAIRPGMTAGEVEYRLGPPNLVHGTPWISYWHYMPDPGDHRKILTVIEFWNGRVHAKERIYR